MTLTAEHNAYHGHPQALQRVGGLNGLHIARLKLTTPVSTGPTVFKPLHTNTTLGKSRIGFFASLRRCTATRDKSIALVSEVFESFPG